MYAESSSDWFINPCSQTLGQRSGVRARVNPRG
jgi:hypothetical protein